MTTTAPRTRSVRPDDIPALVELFREAFGKTMSPAHYRWKFLARPSPVDNVVIAVDQADRPVFHSGGIPCRCRLAGAERWVMVGVDVMTAAAFRRQGLHTTHSTELYARWKAAGVALVIGFTNAQWGSTARKVGLRPLGPLASLVLPLRPERMLARKLGFAPVGRLAVLGNMWRSMMAGSAKPVAGVQVQDVSEAGPEFDHLWAQAGAGIERSLVRDRAWVAWRYLAAPDSPYRVLLARRRGDPVGYAAYGRRDRHTAILSEIFTTPGDHEAFAALVRAAVARAVEDGVDSIRTLAAPGSWPYQGFRRARFFSRSEGMVEYIPLDPSISREAVGAARDWYLAAGDFDVV